MKLLNLFAAKNQGNKLPLSDSKTQQQKVQYAPQVWSDVCKPKAPEIAENGADKVLFKSEQNSNVQKRYMNFASAQKRAVDATLYAISSGRFFRKMLRMRRDFLTPCTIKRTQGKKLLADGGSCGRSMVEMLGVLAIIGVLSVGAISGYSKAMYKHKVNIAINQIASLAASIQTVYKDKGYSAISNLLAYKLNIVPDSVEISNVTTSNATFYNPFKGKIQIKYSSKYSTPTDQNAFLIGYSGLNTEQCVSIASAKWDDISANLIAVAVQSYTSEPSPSQLSTNQLYVDSCSASSKKSACADSSTFPLSLSKIKNMCSDCDSKQCAFSVKLY